MSPEQAQPVVRKKSRQQKMSKSEMPASKVSARRLLVDNNNSADEALPQNTTSSAQKNESHPLQNTSTNQSSAMDLPSLPLAVFVFLALLAGVFCLHEIQKRMYQFAQTAADYFLVIVGYYFVMSVLRFDILDHGLEKVVAVLGYLFPTIWMDCWIFPTDDGYEFGDMQMLECLETLWYTLLIIGFTSFFKYLYNSVDLSIDIAAEMIDEPCPLRIGAFEQGADRDYMMFLAPLSPRARSPSETDVYVLEGGLRRGGPRKAMVEPTEIAVASPRNPAYPMLVDFAGAGYGGLIADNKRKLEEQGMQPNLSPAPNRPASPFVSINGPRKSDENIRRSSAPSTALPPFKDVKKEARDGFSHAHLTPPVDRPARSPMNMVRGDDFQRRPAPRTARSFMDVALNDEVPQPQTPVRPSRAFMERPVQSYFDVVLNNDAQNSPTPARPARSFFDVALNQDTQGSPGQSRPAASSRSATDPQNSGNGGQAPLTPERLAAHMAATTSNTEVNSRSGPVQAAEYEVYRADREERRRQFDSLGLECAELERWVEQQRDLVATYDAQLEPRLRQHYENEALRLGRAGESAIGSMEQQQEDPEEAAIREAFPQFSAFIDRQRS